MRRKLLLLVHRIPYPPDKGDKIRSYHLLRHLAARHEVYLGSFVDDPQDWQHERTLAALCRQVKLVDLNPKWRRLRSLSGLLTGEALSVPYYRVAALQRWVNAVVADEGITHAVVFSSTMAQYVSGPAFSGIARIADLCDVDSDKWRQYAQGKSGPSKWVYAREATRLLDYERAVAREFDATLFVTRAEAELFGTLAPESAEKIGFFDNGVDTDYFDPEQRFESPYRGDHDRARPIVVFTGAMDYWANADAVSWFVQAVWPRVRARAPEALFYIVGSNPGAEVKALESHAGVRVTGRVPDVRPYLAHADVAVAPLRIARGTQNKVLEALAMARPVVCSAAAASGLRVPTGAGFRVASEPADFAEAVLASLSASMANPAGRVVVTSGYSWTANLRALDALLAPPAPA